MFFDRKFKEKVSKNIQLWFWLWTESSERFSCLEFILKKSKHREAGLKHKKAYAYLTHDFQRHFTLNTCLREWKLLSLYMFHRITFILLIVSSPSRNFYRCTGCLQSNINIACRNTQNAARKLSLAFKQLKITHNKTINSFINKGK